MQEETDINTFLDLAGDYPIVDVRTPAEFMQGRIPVAHNIPLFTDAERKSVGTTYKTKGRQPAILEGLDYAGSRLKSYILEARKLASANHLLIHCWRGGMRSSAMAWLFQTYGFQCHVLKDGYKSFRNFALSYFERQFPFVVIGGLTGSGKTEVLRSLAGMGEQILDLEGLSHHKGSAFGHLGELAQNTNEQFENEVFWNLFSLDNSKIIWVEDESRNIGKNTLPGGIYEGIRNAPLIFLDVPMKERILRLVEEYAAYPDDQIIASIEKISTRLGGKTTGEAIEAIHSRDYQRSTGLILGYYDKTYRFGLEKREENKVHKLGIEMPATCSSMAAQILDFTRKNSHSWNLFN